VLFSKIWALEDINWFTGPEIKFLSMNLNSFQVAWGTDLCGLISDHLALNQKCIIQKLTKCLRLLKMSKCFF